MSEDDRDISTSQLDSSTTPMKKKRQEKKKETPSKKSHKEDIKKSKKKEEDSKSQSIIEESNNKSTLEESQNKSTLEESNNKSTMESSPMQISKSNESIQSKLTKSQIKPSPSTDSINRAKNESTKVYSDSITQQSTMSESRDYVLPMITSVPNTPRGINHAIPRDSVYQTPSRDSVLPSPSRDYLNRKQEDRNKEDSMKEDRNHLKDDSLNDDLIPFPLSPPSSSRSKQSIHEYDFMKPIRDCIREYLLSSKEFLKRLKRLDEHFFSPGMKKGIHAFDKISDGLGAFISSYTSCMKLLEKKYKSPDFNYGSFFHNLFSMFELPLRKYRIAQLQLSSILEREEGAPTRLELFIALRKNPKEELSFIDQLAYPIYHTHKLTHFTQKLSQYTPYESESYEQIHLAYKAFVKLSLAISYMNGKDAAEQEEIKMLENRLVFARNVPKVIIANGKRKIIHQGEWDLVSKNGRKKRVLGILMDDMIILCRKKHLAGDIDDEDHKKAFPLNDKKDKSNMKKDKSNGSFKKDKSNGSLKKDKGKSHVDKKYITINERKDDNEKKIPSNEKRAISSDKASNIDPLDLSDIRSKSPQPQIVSSHLSVIMVFDLSRIFLVDPHEGIRYNEDGNTEEMLDRRLEIGEVGVSIHRLLFDSISDKNQWKQLIGLALCKINKSYSEYEVGKIYRILLNDLKKSNNSDDIDVDNINENLDIDKDDTLDSSSKHGMETILNDPFVDAWPYSYSLNAIQGYEYNGLYGNRPESERRLWEEMIQMREFMESKISTLEQKIQDMDVKVSSTQQNAEVNVFATPKRQSIKKEKRSSTVRSSTQKRKSKKATEEKKVVIKGNEGSSTKIKQSTKDSLKDEPVVDSTKDTSYLVSRISHLEEKRDADNLKIEKLERAILLMRDQHLSEMQKLFEIMNSTQRHVSPTSAKNSLRKGRRSNRTLNAEEYFEERVLEDSTPRKKKTKSSLENTPVDMTESSSSRKIHEDSSERSGGHKKDELTQNGSGKLNGSAKKEFKSTPESRKSDVSDSSITPTKGKTKKLKNTKFSQDDYGASWRDKTLKKFGFSSKKRESVPSPWRRTPLQVEPKQDRFSLNRSKNVDWSNVNGENYFSDDFGSDYEQTFFVQSDYARHESPLAPKEEFSDYSDGEYHKRRRRYPRDPFLK